MTARWWRRNAVALLALVVLVPAGVWAFDQIEGAPSRSAVRDVAPGESAQVEDWSFGMPRLEPVDPAEVGAPAGSLPVVVRIPVSPGTSAVSCTEPTILDPASGREWAPSNGLDWKRASDDLAYCRIAGADGGSVAPFDVTTLVLLPGDAPADLVVSLPAYPSDADGLTNLRIAVSR